MDGARRFYGQLLGWTAFDVPSAAGSYSLLRVDGKDVAGLHRSERGEPAWLCYVAVDSTDRVVARAVELGGTLLVPPFDVPGVGRMAMIQDPGRAMFALWEARGMIGARLADEPGAPCWYELVTHDLPASVHFYSALFGWSTSERTLEPGGPYTVASKGGRSVAGMMTIRKEWGDVPPRWQVYFAVDDCTRAVRKAVAHGGRVIAGPQDVRDVGEFAVLADPSEAVFAVFRAPSPR
jgi:predicted enzyme related to lactoylglutathione lyase